MLELLGGDKAAQLSRRPKAAHGDDDGIRGVLVAVWRSNHTCPPGKEVNRALDKAVAALKAAGAKVEELVPPMDPLETYLIYLRFLGPLTGPQMSQQQKKNVQNGAGKDSYPPEMRSPYWEMGVSGVKGVPKGNLAAYEKAASIWDEHLKINYDIVLPPVFPTEAWPKASYPTAALPNVKTGAQKFSVDQQDEQPCYGDALFWAHLSALCGFPATSFPVCHTESDGLPVGLQAFGCKGSDFIILDVVRWLMKELNSDRFEPPSNFADF
jgi:Asp-tRNA(Asn)/Glu-tRNA(Gln) amidotransferase A subunit family amidase